MYISFKRQFIVCDRCFALRRHYPTMCKCRFDFHLFIMFYLNNFRVVITSMPSNISDSAGSYIFLDIIS